jgi:hypothetical protein
MRARLLILSLAILATEGRHMAEAEQLKPQGNQARTLFPSLTAEDPDGHSLPLLSLEAYRAEFRYLRRTFLQTDLKGPTIVTDGWTTNIAEAEWPFMAFAYFGYACANLAKLDHSIRSDALAEMRWLIDALQTPRMSGFVTPHFGEPFGTGPLTPSVFVHGHFLNLAVRYREVSGDARYDPLIHRIAGALNQSFQTSRQGILKSYRDMWWISDNLPALSALARYDRIYRRDTSAARNKFLQHVKAHYLDARTGLLCTYVDADHVRQIQGARGISTMYGLHFLGDLDDAFATNQYHLARQHFVREIFGVAAVREFAEGTGGTGDIDSGPLVFGLGPSASGFAIAAAAAMQDKATAGALLKAAVVAGLPEFRSTELAYTLMPPVGQAVILFGKTELWSKLLGTNRNDAVE